MRSWGAEGKGAAGAPAKAHHTRRHSHLPPPPAAAAAAAAPTSSARRAPPKSPSGRAPASPSSPPHSARQTGASAGTAGCTFAPPRSPPPFMRLLDLPTGLLIHISRRCFTAGYHVPLFRTGRWLAAFCYAAIDVLVVTAAYADEATHSAPQTTHSGRSVEAEVEAGVEPPPHVARRAASLRGFLSHARSLRHLALCDASYKRMSKRYGKWATPLNTWLFLRPWRVRSVASR